MVLVCLVSWTASSQIEDFLAVNKPMAIDFKDDVMYMVLNSSGGSVSDGAIAKVNLTDPDLNIEILVDNLVYPRAIHIVGNDLYYALPTSIRRIDVTDSNPVPEIIVSGTNYVRAFSYKDNYLYLAETDKISKIDITQSSPSKTTVINGFSPFPLALEERNNELYIAHSNKVSKIDLSDPSPVLIDVLPNLNANPYGMDFIGDELFIEQTFAVSTGSKQIVKCDVSQSSLMVEEVITYGTSLSMIDVKFHENDLYIVFGGFGNKIAKLENADALSLDDYFIEDSASIFPNPAHESISLSNLKNNTLYTIYNVNGKIVQNGIVSINESISIAELNSGFYFISIDNKNTLKFIKL